MIYAATTERSIAMVLLAVVVVLGAALRLFGVQVRPDNFFVANQLSAMPDQLLH